MILFVEFIIRPFLNDDWTKFYLLNILMNVRYSKHTFMVILW